MIKFRKATSGDALSINQLYFKVTDRCRSINQYLWQWWSYPNPSSFSYVITELDSLSKESIIGHHGIMVTKFYYDSKYYLVGKTENTMVDPDYRSVIVYPRFEKRFLNDYKDKISALFSTSGPQNAIKTRYILGYKPIGSYRLYITLPILSRILCFIQHSLISLSGSSPDYQIVDANLIEPDYINSIWDSAKSQYPFTPSRDYDQFHWRFIQNPYKNHYVLKSSIGYIVFFRSKFSITIVDAFPLDPTPRTFFLLLKQLASKTSLFSTIRFKFCLDNSLVSHHLKQALDKFSRLNLFYLHKKQKPMPRFCTSSHIPIDEWYVTGFLGEGR